MSKSLERVKRQLAELALDLEILHLRTPTTTALEAANAVSCQPDQIAKSVIFAGSTSGNAVLFLTAGGNRVDLARARELTGEPLGKADARFIRAQTGFAIGGVSPFGHIKPLRTFLDSRLTDFALIWAAAGTPHHMFQIKPQVLIEKTGAIVAHFAA